MVAKHHYLTRFLLY